MNSFGTTYRMTIYGESHGQSVGVLLDGVPAGIELNEQDFMEDLLRRKSGARGTTSRKESDTPKILSGVFEGRTTGAPMLISFENENTISGDYSNLVSHPRPGHSDYVAMCKYYGCNDFRGGGHFSGRVTLGLVAGGVVAKKMLSIYDINITSNILEIGGQRDKAKFAKVIDDAMKEMDSVGGVIECTISGIPVGLGEPFFNSIESVMSHAIFSIPAIRGIEFGEGFAAAAKRGSEHNDMIIDEFGTTSTNHAGGINGGISNGNDIIFRVAVKPTSSIAKAQQTFNFEKKEIDALQVKGRHDACIALRAPVVVESVAAAVIADFMGCDKTLE